MDLQNTTFSDEDTALGTDAVGNSSSFSSAPNISMELTTLITSLNEENQSTVASTYTEDIEILLPVGLVSLRNICVHYVSFIIWIFSFPANIFIIFILVQKKNRKFSTSIYFISLAAADLVVNFRTLLFWLDGSKLVTYGSTFECKLSKGLPLVGMIGSSWTLAFISTERMLSVCLLQKVKVLCKVNIARVCVIGIWVLSCTVGSVHAWFNEFNGSRCQIKRMHLAFFVDYVIYVYFALDIVVPFFVIFVNSIIIVSRLAFIKANSRASSQAFGKSVTVLVLVVNVVFIITQFPYGVMFVVQQTNVQYASKQRMAILDYLEQIFVVLKYVNNGINFYIYFLAASKFRQEAKDIIAPCARCFSRIRKRRDKTACSLGSTSTQLQSI